jgi:hypothetical protein
VEPIKTHEPIKEESKTKEIPSIPLKSIEEKEIFRAENLPYFKTKIFKELRKDIPYYDELLHP